MDRKIKVVWVCHFSDQKTRDHIRFVSIYYKLLFQFIAKSNADIKRDMAVWVSNTIKEFEKFDDIDLTIIFPHPAIKGLCQEFSLNNVHYVCFRSEDDHFVSSIKNRVFHKSERYYYKNRKFISDYISKLSPDIVHLIGAENPYYSISALDVPKSIPLVVSLQTILADPDFLKNYNIGEDEYKYRSKIEFDVVNRSDYIATSLKKFKEIVKQRIKPNAVFLQMDLALGQELDLTPVKKEFDFVYFAANLEKAGDYAIEAFALVCRCFPKVTLNMSGYYTSVYKAQLDSRLKELGITNNVIFTGQQQTHNDVLHQIKKSRFALLPLKIDLISGTIRESMACGLPVVTTITPATPELNSKRESVLLSEKGDFSSMADNMMKLLRDESYADRIRENGLKTVQEKYSNKAIVQKWHLAYYEIIGNFIYGKGFSKHILSE